MEENKGEKKWDNCNSIINKIYFLKILKTNSDSSIYKSCVSYANFLLPANNNIIIMCQK